MTATAAERATIASTRAVGFFGMRGFNSDMTAFRLTLLVVRPPGRVHPMP
jgi:hypothetical protein